MEILILSACGLVANQYARLKRRSAAAVPGKINQRRIGYGYERGYEHEPGSKSQLQMEPELEADLEAEPAAEPAAEARAEPEAGPAAEARPEPEAGPGAEARPEPGSRSDLGVRILKTVKNAASAEGGYDDARFDEQYSHPQDPNPTVSYKPWMRMADAPYKPKEEILSDIPGPQDVMGHDMKSRVSQIESDFAARTVPVTSEKQFDRPVEQVSTGNGSAIGFHIGAGRRYYKFVLNDQPVIESEGGPRGAFAGASKADVKGDYRTVTQRSSLRHESMGPPVAAGVPQSSVPPPSFELAPSHLEFYDLNGHMSNGIRAPVQAPASSEKRAFSVAHDENIQVLPTALVTGGERFATGASGYRDAQVFVPLNNDPLATYEQRVVPNYKIAKASDYQEQQVTARQMMIPEMPQNVSALRKNSKPPVCGSAISERKVNFSLKTEGVLSGSAVRGTNSLPVTADQDAFRAPTDRREVVAEKAALVCIGSAASSAVPGSASASASASEFRTTHSISEVVGTPFIRGAGTKHGTALQPVHEKADTHLAEREVAGLRLGLNKSAVNIKNKKDVDAQRESRRQSERGDVFKQSERDPVVVPAGEEGIRRTGAANRDASGMVSDRGLCDDDDLRAPLGLGSGSGSGSGAGSGAGASSGRTSNARVIPSRGAPAPSGTNSPTKNRKLGTVLNARLGSSSALKRLLRNPYSLPAATRLSSEMERAT